MALFTKYSFLLLSSLNPEPLFLSLSLQPGSAIKFNQYKREGCEWSDIINDNILTNLLDTDFVALGHNNNAWNVVN